SWVDSEAFPDIFGGLWLADYICSFLNGGGKAVYFFHYMPEAIGRGINGSRGTFAMFSADRDYKILQPLSQYFSSQLINLEWVQPGSGEHKLFNATSDITDGAGNVLVTTYAVQRPDGQWSLLIINKDQENSHNVKISFDNAAQSAAGTFAGQLSVKTFGQTQYQWHPKTLTADPDGPIASTTVNADANSIYELPASSITVLRGNVVWPAPGASKQHH
ncbi:MAG: hypothetical protein WBU20_10670, partial [Candidatus Acidiferrum sp.]